MKNKKKARIAMSGGVDSCVAALLMLREDFDCSGITMITSDAPHYYKQLYGVCHNSDFICNSNSDNCGFSNIHSLSKGSDCSNRSNVGNFICDRIVPADKCTKDALDAKKICETLWIEHVAVDYSDLFAEKVIKYFISEYKYGRTPNPCIVCNRDVKFSLLMNEADDSDFYYVTGHYARVEYDEASGMYQLKKAKCLEKDQSYVLYNLKQEQLAKIRFPLGKYTKDEVRAIAEQAGLQVSHKKDSQDICFIPDGDYTGFIAELTGDAGTPGDFVTMDGKVLGRHKGQLHYTIGQRKGLGLALPAPLYVYDNSNSENKVVLCTNDELFSDNCIATDVNFCSILRPEENVKIRCEAKIRYAHKPQPATAYMVGDELHVLFDEPQRAMTPGQSVVLYDGDIVLGGGVISSKK